MTNLSENYDFSNQVVVITGAGRGIGFALSEAFARAGAVIVMISKSHNVFEAAERLKMMGFGASRINPYQADVSSPEEIAKVFKEVNESHQSIDVLVNNASIIGPTGPLASNELRDWERVFQVNVFGTVNVIHHVLPFMQRHTGGGSIINFSGGGAANPSPNFSAYGASKSAVVRLTETLATELADSGIRVNVIAPGANNTDMFRTFIQAGGQARTVVSIDKPINLVLWLASDSSKQVTGKFIHVNDEYKSFDWVTQPEDLFCLRRIEP